MNLLTLDRASFGMPITRLGIAFFPIYLPDSAGTQIGDSSTGVTIAESENPQVSGITVTNTNSTPCLLVDGETVRGGKQDRTLNVSVLVAAGSTIECPVSCVERGRWNAGAEFGRSNTYTPRRVRRAKQYSVNHNISKTGSRNSDQGMVWESVDYELSRLDCMNDSSALRGAEDIFERSDGTSEVVRELVDLGPLPRQCGVVVAHGRRVVGAEVLASPELFASHWEALIRGWFLDIPEHVDGYPSLNDAARFLWRFAASATKPEPAVGLGTEYHVSDERLVGQALVWDDTLIHASAFAMAV